jgi:hypothetical protein
MQGCGLGAGWRHYAGDEDGNPTLPEEPLLHLICIFARILRISIYGCSDLLSSLYAASRAQVTFDPN